MKVVPILKGSKGINNAFDPARIDLSKEAMPYLAEAVNIDIDDTGRISRIKGYVPTARTEATHSLFTGRLTTLCVSEDTLYRLDENMGRTAIRTGLSRCNMAYVEIGDVIYYSNGHETGKVVAGASAAWQAGAYVGPDTTKHFSSPPAGNHLEFYNGRIWIASEDILWYTEPFAYSWVNKATNFFPIYNGGIRMLKAVADGLYIGTEKGTFFLGGPDPSDMVLRQVDKGKVFIYSGVTVSGRELALVYDNGLSMPGNAVIWATKDGVMIGYPGGQVKAMTGTAIALPDADTAYGMMINNRYLLMIDQ
jgi:hypothetical protein